MNTSVIAKWLDVTKAQRLREAKNIETKYGKEAAQPMYNEVTAIDQVINSFRAMPTTPLEEWLETQKKKGAR